MPFCRRCGAEYPPGTPFCTKDGSPLAAPTDTDPYAPTSERQGALPYPEPATIPDSAPIALDASAFDSLEMGIAVGEYRVTDQIGEGGMGVVYGGVHPVIGKKVAIKVLRPEFASRPDVVQRFISEARAVNAIGSRHIVNIFSFGQLADGRHYYVMDRLSGRSLAAYLRALEKRDFPTLAPIIEDILTGLAAAHAAKIVHRDLKPDNIFVVEEQGSRPMAVLLDFGIAKLLASPEMSGPQTRTGAVLGTPYYMAPEQFRSAQVDARADLYALGVILYEVFAGKVPFAADSYIDLVNKHLSEPPARPAAFDRIPPRLERLILRLLAKSPAERPPSAESVLQELSAIRRGEPMTDERMPQGQSSRVRRWPWAVAAGVMLAGGAVAAVTARAHSDDRQMELLRMHSGEDRDDPGVPPPDARPQQASPEATGTILVRVRPGGQVSVDGQPAGEGTEVRATGLIPGRHLVEVRRAGFRKAEREVVVSAGHDYDLDIDLVKAKPRPPGAPAGVDDDSATLNPFQKRKP